MICPNCMVQMHQHKRVGGGFSKTDDYVTWELKECPQCKDFYVEYYRTFRLDGQYKFEEESDESD